jgi:hypothetical protein
MNKCQLLKNNAVQAISHRSQHFNDSTSAICTIICYLQPTFIFGSQKKGLPIFVYKMILSPEVFSIPQQQLFLVAVLHIRDRIVLSPGNERHALVIQILLLSSIEIFNYN